MRSEVRGPHAVSRNGIGEPLGHAGDRIERLGGECAGRRRLEVCGAVADPERLGASGIAQEAQHRQEGRRIGLAETDRTDRFGFHVAAALTAIVVALEVAGALVPDLEHLALPERRQLGRARTWGGTQRRAVLYYDRERRSKAEQHLRALPLHAHGHWRGVWRLRVFEPDQVVAEELAWGGCRRDDHLHFVG